MSKKEEMDFINEIAKELTKKIENNKDITSEELAKEVVKRLFPDVDEDEFFDEQTKLEIQADDLLQEAYDAKTEKQAKEYAKQALKLNPKLVDAESFLIEFEKDPLKRLEKYAELKEKAKDILQSGEEDYFTPENVGIFWGLIETRPYMRVCHVYMLTLMELGRYTKAIEQGEEMLLLCENDNLGIRTLLLTLYTMLERFEDAEKLHKKYKEDDFISTLFPLSIMYYRKGDLNKAKKVIQEMKESNKYIIPILTKMFNEKEFYAEEIEAEPSKYLELGSKQEAFTIIHDNMALLATVPDYIEFVKKCMQDKPKTNLRRIK